MTMRYTIGVLCDQTKTFKINFVNLFSNYPEEAKLLQ